MVRDRDSDIVEAAIAVFGERGFHEARIDEIARRADVAKPTLYTRYADKESLFLAAMERGVEHSRDRISAAIAASDPRPDDLRGELQRLGDALVGCLMEDKGTSLTRLQLAERSRFPELDGLRIRARDRNLDELAGRLARWANDGRLRIPDPDRAARQFLALVTDDALAESGFGSRPLDRARAAAGVAAGVDTFLAAFEPR